MLGNNMFAYCQNNPVVYIDPDGLCREVGALLTWIDCRKPDCPTSKYYVKNVQVRKTVQVANALIENIELSGGVGLGLHGGVTLLDLVDVSGGQRYDLFYVGYADGELFNYQAYYEGIEVWVAQMIGFDINSSQTIRDNPITGNDFSWREDPAQNSWTIFETGAYAGIGGRIRIGFDSISFFEELHNIIS